MFFSPGQQTIGMTQMPMKRVAVAVAAVAASTVVVAPARSAAAHATIVRLTGAAACTAPARLAADGGSQIDAQLRLWRIPSRLLPALRVRGAVAASQPERRYDLAGEILATAIERSMRESVPVAEAVRAAAAERGRRIAAEPAPADGPANGGDVEAPAGLEGVARVLARHGYEPRLSGDGQIRLANCPFDRLAGEHRDLVCGMNLSFVEGVLAGLEIRTLRPRLEPDPERCCVKVAG